MKFFKICNQIINEENKLYLLLEKDHRNTIINKIKLPEDVANYLHELDDKYSLWFADKINKMPEFHSSQYKVNWIRTNLQTIMQGILDWIRNSPSIKLNDYNWTQAREAQEEYHDNLESQSLEGTETNTIIKKYKDGFYWVDLQSYSCKEEEQLMGHCGGSAKAQTLYSLRKYDPHTQTIEAFITLAISPDENTWYQCKGKKNSLPKPEYHPYIADILMSSDVFKFKTEYKSHLDFKAEDLIEYLKKSDKTPEIEKFIKKITSDVITYRDFEDVIKEYEPSSKYTLYEMELDDDNNVNLQVSMDFTMKIHNENMLDHFIKNEVKSGLPDYYEELIDIIKSLLNLQMSFNVDSKNMRWDVFGNNVSIRFNLDLNDSQFSVDSDGLQTFNELFNDLRLNESRLNIDEFVLELERALILSRMIDDARTDVIDKLGELNLYKVKNIELDNDLNIEIDFQEFVINNDRVIPDRYKIFDMVSGRLTEKQKQQDGDLQYYIDFFHTIFIKELQLEKVDCMFKSFTPTSIYFNYFIQDGDFIDNNKIIKNIKTISNKYDSILTRFRQYYDTVLKPIYEKCFYTLDDVKFDESFFNAELQKVVNIPIYDKLTGELIASAHIDFRKLQHLSVPERVENMLKQYNIRKNIKYDSDISKNFFESNKN
ncbi:MAG: hypothetical protein K9L64_04270 [Candidatus Izimaplasma sp.]|nr:hypothetical protein [Candidatus Izimaplasma bacterium]